MIFRQGTIVNKIKTPEGVLNTVEKSTATFFVVVFLVFWFFLFYKDLLAVESQ